MLDTFLTFLNSLLQSDTTIISAFAVWLSTFSLGENGALIAFTLSLQGFIDPSIALCFVFLGSLSADMFWYVMTTSAIRPWYERRFGTSKTAKEAAGPFLSLAEKHPYGVLVIIKFLVGIRLFLTIYILTKKHIRLSAYLLCNILANILFTSAVYLLAFSFYKGAEQVLTTEHTITTVITMLCIVGIGGNLLIRLISALVVKITKKSFSK